MTPGTPGQVAKACALKMHDAAGRDDFDWDAIAAAAIEAYGKQYPWMSPADAAKAEQLNAENERLRQRVAELEGQRG
jgi:hypothetical protein